MLAADELQQQAGNISVAYAQFRDQSRFWIQRVAVPLLMVIGLFGNLITVVIMTRRRMRSTTNLYLAALAFVDMMYLVLTFALGLSHYPNMAEPRFRLYWRLKPFLMMLTDACSNTSVWLTVTFTIERFIAVKYPMEGRVWCTEARAKRLIGCVFAFSILFAAPVPFEWKVIERAVSSGGSHNNSQPQQQIALTLDNTDFGLDETYRTIYYRLTAILFYFLPLISVTLFNCFLIHSVHRSRIERNRMTNQKSQSPESANGGRRPLALASPSTTRRRELAWRRLRPKGRRLAGHLISSESSSRDESAEQQVVGAVAKVKAKESESETDEEEEEEEEGERNKMGASKMRRRRRRRKRKRRRKRRKKIRMRRKNRKKTMMKTPEKFSCKQPGWLLAVFKQPFKSKHKLESFESVESKSAQLDRRAETNELDEQVVVSQPRDRLIKICVKLADLGEDQKENEEREEICGVGASAKLVFATMDCDKRDDSSETGAISSELRSALSDDGESTPGTLPSSSLTGVWQASWKPNNEEPGRGRKQSPAAPLCCASGDHQTGCSNESACERCPSEPERDLGQNERQNQRQKRQRQQFGTKEARRRDNEQKCNVAEQAKEPPALVAAHRRPDKGFVARQLAGPDASLERTGSLGSASMTSANTTTTTNQANTIASAAFGQATKATATTTGTQSVAAAASSQERRITIMLIAVVLLFLVCQIPSAAMLLYTSVYETRPNTNEHALLLALGNIFNFLMAVNAAGNFILYSFLSKKYRRTFVILFCSCFKPRQNKHPRGASGATYSLSISTNATNHVQRQQFQLCRTSSNKTNNNNNSQQAPQPDSCCSNSNAVPTNPDENPKGPLTIGLASYTSFIKPSETKHDGQLMVVQTDLAGAGHSQPGGDTLV